MAEQFYTILTNVGKAKIANALPTGTKVNLTKMKIGDSNGTYYNPSESQTELVHKVYECNVTSVEVDESNPNWITITAAIPSDVGGFSIREVGVFDDSNSLIAIGKYPETYKPVASDGSVKELYIKMTLEVVNASSVELKIDPTIILATKKDIANINTKVEDVTTQLDTIENEKINKINTIVNLVDDYGAKANIDFDNSPILQNAINDLSAKFGGTIIIPNGLYIFKTPIFFDNTYGVKIVGTSDITDDQKGTVLKYVGQDWFFTMSSVRKSLFERIVFKGNLGENKGILINSIYSSDFKNCVISDFNIGIQIDDCAYLNIERTHFIDNANSNVLHQLYVSASKFLEFLYVTKCTFDGSYRIGDMVKIEGGLYVYFSNCDFCNFKGKLLIDIKQDNESIIFNECSFMGIRDGVVVKNTDHHVNTIIFDKCILHIKGVNEPEKGFILTNQSNSQGFNVVIDKLSVRKFSNTVYSLENILECTGNGKVRGKLDIINNVFPNAKVLFNNRESIFPVSGIVSKKGTFIVERQEDVKYYDINLFSNSPFVGQPNFVINCQDVYEYRYSSNNINGGDCNIRINFKDTPHKDFVFYYSIIE